MRYHYKYISHNIFWNIFITQLLHILIFFTVSNLYTTTLLIWRTYFIQWFNECHKINTSFLIYPYYSINYSVYYFITLLFSLCCYIRIKNIVYKIPVVVMLYFFWWFTFFKFVVQRHSCYCIFSVALIFVWTSFFPPSFRNLKTCNLFAVILLYFYCFSSIKLTF